MQQKYFWIIQKVCSLKTSNFWPAPPCSSLFILHARCLCIFLNEKLRSKKRENNYFFLLTQHKRWQCFLHRYIHTITTRKIFTCSYILKKVLKNVYTFIIKLSATTKQRILFDVWKIRQFFSQGEHRDRLNPSPPSVCFHLLIKDPPLPLQNKPFIKKSSLEEMEGVNDNASVFIHLNIKANK